MDALTENSTHRGIWKNFEQKSIQIEDVAYKLAYEATRNPWADAAGAGTVVLGVIASRSRLSEVAAGILPNAKFLIEDLRAAKESLVKEVAHSESEDESTLKFDSDLAKVAAPFGPNAVALPSMYAYASVFVTPRIAIVDTNSVLAKTYKRVEPSVFSLHALNDDEEIKIGTAFLTEDNYLGTAGHCVMKSWFGADESMESNLFVRIARGKRLPLSVVAYDSSADVALLKFKEPVEVLPPALELGSASSLKLNAHLTNLGYPASSNKMVFTEGRVQNVRAVKIETNDANTAMIESNVMGFGGSSGAPIMADELVVGVHVGMSGFKTTRAVAIEHVRFLLDQVRENPECLDCLRVKSIGRVLGDGNHFIVKVEELEQPDR